MITYQDALDQLATILRQLPPHEQTALIATLYAWTRYEAPPRPRLADPDAHDEASE